jgi:hypothetical protein
MSINIRFEIHVYVNKSSNANECHPVIKRNSSTKRWFLQLATEEAKRLSTSLSRSTIENYNTALRVFRRYLKHDIDVKEVNQELIKGFERWLRNQNLCLIRYPVICAHSAHSSIELIVRKRLMISKASIQVETKLRKGQSQRLI